MERCDVLVVGGGPAGSSCAWRLRRAGADVVVMDRRRFPRDKTCAGWITPQVIRALELDLEAYAAGRVLQPIHGFRISRQGGRESAVDYGEPVSFGIRRWEFDDYLLRRSGARLRLGETAREFQREGGRWTVNGAIEAPVLVGAGGHFCPVAQHLGAIPGPPAPVVAAQELEFPLGDPACCSARPELPELFFAPDLAGYGWLVRKGEWLNVGLGRQDVHELSLHVTRFVDFLRQTGRLPGGLPGRPHGHAYLLYGEARRPLARDGVLLIGDAAGLAYPRSGEGIRPAVESGLLAAAAVLEAAGAPERIDRYAEAIVARFGPRAGRAPADPLAAIPQAWKAALAGRLLASRSFARRVVLDRWFLHRSEPALAGA